MSIYMTIASAEKDAEVDLPSNRTKKYHLTVYLHHPAGCQEDVIEIEAVNRDGEEEEVIVRVSDLLPALAHVFLRKRLEGWETWDISEEVKEIIGELRREREKKKEVEKE